MWSNQVKQGDLKIKLEAAGVPWLQFYGFGGNIFTDLLGDDFLIIYLR